MPTDKEPILALLVIYLRFGNEFQKLIAPPPPPLRRDVCLVIGAVFSKNLLQSEPLSCFHLIMCVRVCMCVTASLEAAACVDVRMCVPGSHCRHRHTVENLI